MRDYIYKKGIIKRKTTKKNYVNINKIATFVADL